MKLRSDKVTKGVERAPMRSLFYAMGFTEEELKRPLIGVVSAYSEIVPGHIHLDKIAEAAKAGVRMAGGTPILDSFHRRMRWHRHGSRRDEVQPGQQGIDC
jgi:dihydroxy-acid dehydratase